MSLTHYPLLSIPTLPLAVAIIAIASAIAVFALIAVRKFVPHHRLKLHNDVAGSVFATVGVLYAVLLAFVVVIVWQNFDKSNVNVQTEANCVADLYRYAESFSTDFKEPVRGLLKDYTKSLVDEEWEAMKKGELSQHTASIMKDMWRLYSSYEPERETDRVFFEESIRKLTQLGELRRTRLMESRTGVHPVLWLVLIIGGVLTILFVSFFGSENLNAQILMAALLAALIALILVTIFVLDYPFSGDVHISSEPFNILL